MLTRKFVIVMVGWLLFCANQSPSTQANSSPVPKSRAIPVASFTPFSGYSSDPCYKTKNSDVAALCAQWKAADAAKSSADASWWTVYFAGFGIALAAITMAAAIAAAYFAKKAAYENKRSANAAHDANRPWLDVDVKLRGVCVNYDRKGYSLQLEVRPLNAGVAPAIDVREQVQCLFYAPKDGDLLSFNLAARDQALQNCADAVAAKLHEERDAGLTVFPGRTQPLYIETFVPWDFSDGYPSGLAWLIVGLRYSFPEGSGETIKLFSVRSFGFPDYAGFECMGSEAFATVKTDPILGDWPRHGYVK
ncbi:hypothetical protein O6V14_10380 [Sphingomonas faeni]|uniref:hypothetical protein n=1 Tax=Sphingomonas TaxID=13687 RepID=UPI002FE4292D